MFSAQQPSGTILVLNTGSSSVKFSVFACDGDVPVVAWRGQVESLDTSPRFSCSDAQGKAAPDGARAWTTPLTHAAALQHVVGWLEQHANAASLMSAGHRIVHGGGHYTQPVRLDAGSRAALRQFIPLAPLHQPHNLSGVDAIAQILPDLPQFACFDTAFHATMPDVAATLALPAELRASGLRRYGFHGLSYEHVAAQLPSLLAPERRGRVVAAHLGNGASVCALLHGQSQDTSMGFSTLDGLVMGTRPGSLDPGVLLFLMRERGMDAAALEDLLYKRSGLLGLSGLNADMRALEASDDPRARMAIDSFVYRLVQHTGAMAAALGGLDALVFTGGIGEHSALVRARVCTQLGWLGLALDGPANAANHPRISAPHSAIAALVIPADEEGVIARHVLSVLRG